MKCKNCLESPVINIISGRKLCKSHFMKFFEKKVFRTIQKYKLIAKNDVICLAISGGKDSLTLSYLLHKLHLKTKNFEIIAIAIDEGIHNYRNKTLSDAKNFCKLHNITLYIYSYKKEFGRTLDQLIRNSDIIPCSICGVLRRYLLNKKARKLNATKLATGHNLDDEAQAILMNQFRNNVQLNARMGPITGIVKTSLFIPRIKPLYFVTDKEVMLYSYLKGFSASKFVECPNSSSSYRGKIREILNELEKDHPGTKYGIINSFIETLPILKQKYEFSGKKINECNNCGEPCSSNICNACKIIEKLVMR